MKIPHAFRIVSLPREIAAAARTSRLDAFGNEPVRVLDGGRHQCRQCLRLSQPGEPVLLIAHRPFSSRQPYAETGPVFVHERDCESYPHIHAWPSGFPRDKVVLRAYDERERIAGAQAVGGRRVEDVIDEMLNDEKIAFLHARNLGYGCYMFRIERNW
ncbi:MAG TPA: DUF1203 domain-containing protein [Gammaproteobacteria bacterium]